MSESVIISLAMEVFRFQNNSIAVKYQSFKRGRSCRRRYDVEGTRRRRVMLSLLFSGGFEVEREESRGLRESEDFGVRD